MAGRMVCAGSQRPAPQSSALNLVCRFRRRIPTPLLRARPAYRKGAPSPGGLAWLIARYRETIAWTDLSRRPTGSVKTYSCSALQTAAAAIRKITVATVVAGRESRRLRRPRPKFLDACAGCSVGGEGEAREDLIQPSASRTPSEEGGTASSRGPRSTLPRMRPLASRNRQSMWLDVLLYTGFAGATPYELGRQHVRDGVATIKTAKSNFSGDGHPAYSACPGRNPRGWPMWRSDVHRG